MGVPITISLNITPKVDNTIWFANAAAWNNYWASVDGEATFEGAATSIYVPIAFDGTLPGYHLITEDADVELVKKEEFDSLVASFQALAASYVAFRSEMKDAGYITQAQ
jgi:hypothetical protein